MSAPRTPSYLVPVETRPRSYPSRLKVFRFVDWSSGHRRGKINDDPGGYGEEIAREIRVCPSCYDTGFANDNLVVPDHRAS